MIDKKAGAISDSPDKEREESSYKKPDSVGLSLREEFAINLIDYARLHGMTQADLCEATGIAKSTMSQYFSGSRYPRPAQMEAIAKCFGITVTQLVGSVAPEDEKVIDLPYELRVIAQEGQKLSKDQRQSLLRYCRFMFPEVFDAGEDD